MDDFLKWVNGVSAFKSAHDIAIGDTIRLPTNELGVVDYIFDNKFVLQTCDGIRQYDIHDIQGMISNGCDSDQVPKNVKSNIYNSGDVVNIRNFYSAGNGEASGLFVSYNNDRKTATIDIGGEYRSVSLELISPKRSNTNLNNSGKLSPISLSTSKDKEDMKSMEQIMKDVSDSLEKELREDADDCECGSYDCESCYPITEDELSYYADSDDDDYMSGRIGDDEPELSIDDENNPYDADMGGDGVEPSEDVSELISQILYMQEIGMSNSDKTYSEETLMRLSPSAIQRVFDKVTGTVEEMSSGSVAVAYESEDTDVDSESGRGPSHDVSELVAEILFIQDAGMSASNKYFSKDTLLKLSPDAVKNVYDRVYGNVEESHDLDEAQTEDDLSEESTDIVDELDEMVYDDEDTLAPDHVKRKKQALADPLGLGYSKGEHDHLTYSGGRDDVIDMEYLSDPDLSKKYYDEYSPTDIMTQGRREYDHDADSYYDDGFEDEMIPEESDVSDDMPEPTYKDADEDVSEVVSRIMDIQNSGMSVSDKYYSEETLHRLPYASVLRVLKKVEGNVSEAIPLAAIGTAARVAGAAMDAYDAYKSYKDSGDE